MVITCWKATHGDEVGIILLNDWALGNYFGGRTGFEAELRRQGFTEVLNLATEEEVRATTHNGKKLAAWSGPWLTEYPWTLN